MVVSVQASAAVFQENVVTNGKFANGLTDWSLSNMTSANLEDQYALDGAYVTLGQINQTQTFSQIVTIPEDAGLATLSFYYRFYTDDTANDALTIRLTHNGTAVLSDAITASGGDVTTWTKYTMDASALAGKTVTLSLGVSNNGTALTFIDIDTVKLVAKSKGELKATVKDAAGDAIRNAEVTIRKANNKKVWTGTTNKQGKFTASLNEQDNKYRVVIKKSGQTLVKRVRIEWAERTTKEFTFDTL